MATPLIISTSWLWAPATSMRLTLLCSLHHSAPAVSSAVEAPSSTSAQDAPPVLPYRVGHGFDLHRLAEGYPLIIGGITIPHTKGCEAHSDGDVLLHCIVDAINGALSLPDIGQMFPDNDPKWKGAASHIFIAESVRLMRERGYVIGNLDATLIAQKPKLSPHKAREAPSSPSI
ncbi:unnamed protein product [Ostreobium quekettii]|uniref:2-C-methyl-D-erythritol 2,4-cyclodiphosphate synthase n=1 Tax=Ostreobium quekettii TaxID=121088 RepID=A0A8S1IX03_9CHLO|nr:unnamed protein product [Ostreobium quekettii]